MKKQLLKVKSRAHFSAFQRIVWVALFSIATLAASAQTRTLTGTVVDENNQPLAGVGVILDGTSRGISTGADGTFTLTNMPASGNLQVNMIGFVPQIVPITSQTAYRIQLVEDTQFLDEVIVVGYGVMRKSDVTGAVVSVGDAQLQDRPVSNPFQALQGKAAGVDITNSARPGEVGSIRIRGQRSIAASNAPLYVVDGIPLQGDMGLSMLNTYDIKSMEILKDASATAIYGSRGANGVILITTQRGEEGRYSINYNGSITVSTVQSSEDRYNSGEWIDFVRWANYYADQELAEDKRAGYPRADQPTQAFDQLMFGNDQYAWANVMKGWAGGSWNGNNVETTDWADFVTRTGFQHNHSLGISGGTDKIRTRASFGYLDEKGTSYGQEYKRYNFSLNSTIKPNSWFELTAGITGAWTDQEYGQDGTGASSGSGAGSVYASAMRLYPYAVPYDDEGNRILKPGGDDALKTVVDEWKYSRNNRQRLEVLGNIQAQVKLPIDGLIYQFRFGPGFRYNRRGIYIDPQSAIREHTQSLVTLQNNRQFSWTVENQLSYSKVFGKHNVGLTVAQTAEKRETVGDNINGRNVPVASALWNAMGSIDKSADLDGVGSSLNEQSMTSYLFRAQYGYNDKYILTATGRWDGASVLAPGNKWAFFPSVAVAWRMEQEEFIKNVSWINQLKLRVGYGSTGNASVSSYQTIGSISSSLYPYGDVLSRYYYVNDYFATSSRVSLPNQDMGWEKTTQVNFGVDFSLLRNRISGTVEYYFSRTTDLLLPTSIPTLTGYPTITANVGETKNNGVDITLNTVNVRAGAFTWESSLNIAWQKDKIVELANGKEDDVSNNRFIGESIGVYYNYQNAGIWREEDAAEMAKFNSSVNPITGEAKTAHNFKVGQVRPVDQNGDYVISANDDRVIIGQTTPSWTGGMSNTFSYKGVELSVMMYGRMGYWTNGGSVGMGARYMTRKVDYYNENNKNASYQRPQKTSDGSEVDSFSGILAFSKASFINVRHISLGYSFPRSISQKLGMQNLRVYGQVVNPFSIYESVDFKNMDLNSVYWNRQFVFGLNITF